MSVLRLASTDQVMQNNEIWPSPQFAKQQAAFEQALSKANEHPPQWAAEQAANRSHTFAKAGSIGGGIFGTIDGILIWGGGGFFVGAGVGAVKGAVTGFQAAGLDGVVEGALGGLDGGAFVGAEIGAVAGAVVWGKRGAMEGSGVGRDFGNAVWDVTHSGPVSDAVAGIAGAVWGFITK